MNGFLNHGQTQEGRGARGVEGSEDGGKRKGWEGQHEKFSRDMGGGVKGGEGRKG